MSAVFSPAPRGNSWLLTMTSSFSSTTVHLNLLATSRFELHRKIFNPENYLSLDLNSVHPKFLAQHLSSCLEMPAICTGMSRCLHEIMKLYHQILKIIPPKKFLNLRACSCGCQKRGADLVSRQNSWLLTSRDLRCWVALCPRLFFFLATCRSCHSVSSNTFLWDKHWSPQVCACNEISIEGGRC